MVELCGAASGPGTHSARDSPSMGSSDRVGSLRLATRAGAAARAAPWMEEGRGAAAARICKLQLAHWWLDRRDREPSESPTDLGAGVPRRLPCRRQGLESALPDLLRQRSPRRAPAAATNAFPQQAVEILIDLPPNLGVAGAPPKAAGAQRVRVGAQVLGLCPRERPEAGRDTVRRRRRGRGQKPFHIRCAGGIPLAYGFPGSSAGPAQRLSGAAALHPLRIVAVVAHVRPSILRASWGRLPGRRTRGRSPPSAGATGFLAASAAFGPPAPPGERRPVQANAAHGPRPGSRCG
eukprot:scaffold343_cov245-Pinguiococcus_pyrenoidosus.AAC.9